MGVEVDFYYDVVSPWSYIGFEVLLRYEQEWNLDITLKPVFLGGVMQATGNKPPATLPAKATYGMADLSRSSKYFQIPISFPSVFPTNTLSAQRFLQAMILEGKSQELRKVSRSLWQAYWGGKGIDIGAPGGQGIKEALVGVLPDQEIQRLLEISSSPEAKERLKNTTQEVIDLGAFGAPWISVKLPGKEAEVFFGSDRFHLIAELIGKEYKGPFPSRSKL